MTTNDETPGDREETERALNARIAELEAALKPFADESLVFTDETPSEYMMLHAGELGLLRIAVGDLRNAARVLKGGAK